MNKFSVIGFSLVLLLLGLTGCSGTGGKFGFNVGALSFSDEVHPDLALGRTKSGESPDLIRLGGLIDSAETTARIEMRPGHSKALAEKFDLTDPGASSGFMVSAAAKKAREAKGSQLSSEKSDLAEADRAKAEKAMYQARASAVKLEREGIAKALADVKELKSAREKALEGSTFTDRAGADELLTRYTAWETELAAQNKIFTSAKAPTGLERWKDFDLREFARRLAGGEAVEYYAE